MLVALSVGVGSAALEMVKVGEVSALALLISVVAVLTFCVGALIRLLRGSRATVLFAVAAVGFVVAAIQWGLPIRPAFICGVGALAAIVAIVIPYVVPD